MLRPIEHRYFEDYEPGATYEFGSVRVTEPAIIEYARRFDPQPIHVDANAARQGLFGGLIASGWHTGSIMMRLFADHYLSHVASLASPGIDELRWMQPVRPGDVLSIRVQVISAMRSQSKPDRGIVRTRVEVLNQDRAVVMTLLAMNMLRCRDGEAPPQPP